MPTCVERWKKIFDKNLEIKDVFDSCNFHTIHNRKCSDFHWKTVHRAIYSEKRLQQMKRSDGKCKICKTEDETTMLQNGFCGSIETKSNTIMYP